MILKKSSDLIFDSSSEFRKFKKQASEIKELRTTWSKKLAELQEKGYSEKDILNTKMENQKLLEFRILTKTTTTGPFTLSQHVKEFMEEATDGKDKSQDVCRNSLPEKYQTSLKKDAAIFHLLTQDHGFNLCQHLDQSRSVGNVSMGDLRNVLDFLEGRISNKSSTVENVAEIIETI